MNSYSKRHQYPSWKFIALDSVFRYRTLRLQCTVRTLSVSHNSYGDVRYNWNTVIPSQDMARFSRLAWETIWVHDASPEHGQISMRGKNNVAGKGDSGRREYSSSLISRYCVTLWSTESLSLNYGRMPDILYPKTRYTPSLSTVSYYMRARISSV